MEMADGPEELDTQAGPALEQSLVPTAGRDVGQPRNVTPDRDRLSPGDAWVQDTGASDGSAWSIRSTPR